MLSWLQSKPPKNGELRRTPSSITRVWLEPVPRVNTEVSLPPSPEPTTVSPGTRRNISATEPNWASSISSRVTTVTAVGASSSVVSIPVAVTVTSFEKDGVGRPGWAGGYWALAGSAQRMMIVARMSAGRSFSNI